MNKIFLYGVPGSGKTQTSKLLGKETGIHVLEADQLRASAQQAVTVEENPFLFTGTCQAYVHFGELNSTNCIRGLLAVREATAPCMLNAITDEEDIIIEGAFLDPKAFQSFGKLILLVVSDETKHRKRFFAHRQEMLDTENEFLSARVIQKYLIDEAQDMGIDIVESDAQTISTIIAHI